jgi:hypothetical protein
MYFALVCFTSLLSFLVRRCLAEKAGVELPTAGVEGRGACTTGRRGRAARRGHQRRQRIGLLVGRVAMSSLFGWLVADGWCWFVLREEYCWLVAGGWFVVREKYCWLVADKPIEQGGGFGGGFMRGGSSGWGEWVLKPSGAGLHCDAGRVGLTPTLLLRPAAACAGHNWRRKLWRRQTRQRRRARRPKGLQRIRRIQRFLCCPNPVSPGLP